MGHAVAERSAGFENLERPVRLRRVLEGRRQGAGRHELQRLVMVTTIPTMERPRRPPSLRLRRECSPSPELRRDTRPPSEGGWTLIELLVVLSIILILTSL